MTPTAIVGDIHADLDRLNSMLRDERLAGRELVFLGDYVNRGPSSKDVVRRLMSLRSSWPADTHFIRGNHDAAFSAVLDGGPLAPLLLMGGSSTVRSWIPDVVGDVREALQCAVSADEREFFRDLKESWSSELAIAVHERPPQWFSGTSGPLLVVGHYIQRDRRPRIVDGCAYLDSGCGSVEDGCLSALLLPELTFITN